MPVHEPKGIHFETRRRKEQVAFLVVKFLHVHVSFKEIAADFRARSASGDLSGNGLYRRVRELGNGVAFDLKETAHSLFRADAGGRARTRDPRRLLAGMKNSIHGRTIDSYVGTAYHLLLILEESLYQIEHYTPELETEKGEMGRLLDMARAVNTPFSAEERAELERLRALDETTAKLAADSARLAQGVIRRCESLLVGTARVIRDFAAGAADNEILILNLLINRGLVDKVYGKGTAEALLGELCAGRGLPAGTGIERATAFARARCGNVSALEAERAS